MANKSTEESSSSFNEADFEKIVRDVFTMTPYSESHSNNLSGAIHPIFSHSNWQIHPSILQHDSDGEEYFKIIDPVLHLASNLLQSPKSRLFLAYIFYGKREHLVDLSNRLGQKMWQLNRMEGLNFSDALVRTNPLLDHLARHINFHWYDPANPSNDDERDSPKMFGYCRRMADSPVWMSGGEKPTGYMSSIYMNLDMFVKLRQLRLGLQDSSLDEVEGISSQILRLQFFMAVSTCHEVVHAWNISARSIHGATEPFFADERVAELGHSWEGFVIGGILSVRDDIAVGSNQTEKMTANAMLIIKWPDFGRRATTVSAERALPFPFQNNFFISIDWIARIQQEEEWQSTVPEDIIALLEIPRTLGYTEGLRSDEYDPDWKSKWVNELEYIRPEGPNLEPKISCAVQKTLDPEPKESSSTIDPHILDLEIEESFIGPPALIPEPKDEEAESSSLGEDTWDPRIEPQSKEIYEFRKGD